MIRLLCACRAILPDISPTKLWLGIQAWRRRRRWLGRTSPNSKAAATAETFAMHQMIRNMVNRMTNRADEAVRFNPPAIDARPLADSASWSFKLTLALLASSMLGGQAMAQGVAHADYDLAASGYVTPAGMPPMGVPSMGMRGTAPVMPVGYQSMGYPPMGCDSGSCDGAPLMGGVDRMVCGTCGGGGGCGCNGMLSGGLLGKMRARGGPGCLFCRGSGCTACKELPFGYAGSVLACMVGALRPYEEAGLCNQRWYDLSIEALALDRSLGGVAPNVITTEGVNGTPVLSMSDLDGDDVEGGIRLSGALIFGAGGNLEMTYMGGNEWDDSATVTSATPNLFSYISDYGTLPGGVLDPGFDDTDRSLQQSIQNESSFHSAEINYRRRTMFPYCRFQSSWLVGLRYLRYDDNLLYQTTGLDNDTVNGNLPRYFASNTGTQNKLFGPQAGFDFWWNIYPGISMGVGAKAAWMQNDVDRRGSVSANSIPNGGLVVARTVTADDGDQQGTAMADFELKLVYRFSHSWSLRTSYYALAVDDIAFGGLDPNIQYPTATSDLVLAPMQYEDLVLQGFTIGTEYVW
ncbi:BBP7 family outer membrane beta-barrel protein [Stieleria sp. TO1_6]|uniref:BBP7 family outer membrane beta-barrel protein n=1 Tax=Stieleria tagensis TaxID=2956795 RepID=UPI00209B6399|nr:BBP7 family outer membrane beta-barrel protein [Stieleria tagensis]MCO8124360.1 BBP7 family outer membrane beta-barrel protein [Stieleria tagensis]